MSDTYAKFDAATNKITAYALLFAGKPVGRIVIKHGNAATAFVQIWGSAMVTARATGYGYDRSSQAVMSAITKMDVDAPPLEETYAQAWERIRGAAAVWDGGTRYVSALEQAGFTLAMVIG